MRRIPGPNVIGGTGGSGTRVVARVVRSAGMFIGTNLNASEDALDFGDYSNRWIDVFRVGPPSDRSPTVRAAMIDDLRATVDRHLAPFDAGAAAWGWKEPRSIFLLPFFADQFSSLKFLHVIRDGRDMAYSSNQNQLRKHGHVLLCQANRCHRQEHAAFSPPTAGHRTPGHSHPPFVPLLVRHGKKRSGWRRTTLSLVSRGGRLRRDRDLYDRRAAGG